MVDVIVCCLFLPRFWLLIFKFLVSIWVSLGCCCCCCCWLLLAVIFLNILLWVASYCCFSNYLFIFFSWLMFSFLFTVFIIVKSTESVEISTSSFSTWDKPLKHFCFLGNTSQFYILQSFLVINSSGWKRCRFSERELCIFIRLGIAKGRQAASAASVRCRVIKTLL